MAGERTKSRAVHSRRGDGWLARADMLRVWDLSEQAFDRLRRIFPAEAVRHEGTRIYFHCRTCIDAYAAAREKPDDPELSGPVSPALERYREQRALLAELEVQERRGQLVPRDDVRSGLARVASILRRAAEHVGRDHGPTAAAVITDALDDVEREFKEGGRRNAADRDSAA